MRLLDTKKQRKKFNRNWGSLAQIAAMCDKTPSEMRKVLKDLGLADESGWPRGYGWGGETSLYTTTQPPEGSPYESISWNRKNLGRVLEENGHLIRKIRWGDYVQRAAYETHAWIKERENLTQEQMVFAYQKGAAIVAHAVDKSPSSKRMGAAIRIYHLLREMTQGEVDLAPLYRDASISFETLQAHLLDSSIPTGNDAIPRIRL